MALCHSRGLLGTTEVLTVRGTLDGERKEGGPSSAQSPETLLSPGKGSSSRSVSGVHVSVTYACQS